MLLSAMPIGVSGTAVLAVMTTGHSAQKVFEESHFNLHLLRIESQEGAR